MRLEKKILVFRRLQKRYPHWRFGQLIANVAAWAGKDKPGNVWDVPDKDLLQAASTHLKGLTSQSQRQGRRRSA
jgi:hypothetical protein